MKNHIKKGATMSLEEAVNKFVDCPVHLYLKNGCYVDEKVDLQFDKVEHDRLFENGYHGPSYKKWLVKNAKIVEKV